MMSKGALKMTVDSALTDSSLDLGARLLVLGSPVLHSIMLVLEKENPLQLEAACRWCPRPLCFQLQAYLLTPFYSLNHSKS